MNIQCINPYIRVAMESTLAPGTVIHRRVIFDYELIFVESGGVTLTYNETAYPCRAGQFVLIRPDVPHSFSDITTPLSQPHIHFDLTYSSRSARIPVCFRDRDQLTEEEREWMAEDAFSAYPLVPFVTFQDNTAAKALFYAVVRGQHSPPLWRKAQLTMLLDRLIADNFPDCFAQKSDGVGVAQQIKEYWDAGQGLSATLDELESQFNYSKYHLERQFKKEFGTSLITYRNARRMETAQRLLQNASVSAVAEQLGFTSIYVFSRAYKQYFGYPPSQT